jgi:DnaJ-class molecular chaperone
MSDDEVRTGAWPALEVECDRCGGKGYLDDNHSKRCLWCGGHGRVTTDFGDMVLEFVTRRLQAMLRTMLED